MGGVRIANADNELEELNGKMKAMFEEIDSYTGRSPHFAWEAAAEINDEYFDGVEVTDFMNDLLKVSMELERLTKESDKWVKYLRDAKNKL